ncbi:MAG: hypothetical protein IPO08_24775 [Xanthomonadales bacterium]|nr:hypothetical protein [Xanthomonadales bacterium]
MIISRRGILLGAGALVATAVVPHKFVPLRETDMQRLLWLASTEHVIEDQTFYLTGPIVLENITNLAICRCHFIWECGHDGPLVDFRGDCRNLGFSYCHFDTRKVTDRPKLRLYPGWLTAARGEGA